MTGVTVLIPVGPQEVYLQWLPEAIESVLNQTVPVDEILLLADGFDLWSKIRLDTLVFPELYRREGLGLNKTVRYLGAYGSQSFIESHEKPTPQLTVWESPWNIGFAPIFNCGMGLAANDLVIYLAADDRLLPTCVEDCLATWEASNQKDAWYALTYRLQDGTVGDIPINAAMITRNLWAWMKGFPPAAFAAPDALMLSILMVHAPERIIKVAPGKPNYWIRQHANQETGRQMGFYAASGIVEVIRNKETERFIPNLLVELR